MSKDKKLNNLLGMKDFSEKELVQTRKATKRTDVAKDILQEKKGFILCSECGSTVPSSKVEEKGVCPICKADGTLTPAKNPNKKVSENILHEDTGKDVFKEEKMKKKDEVEKKGLNNLISLDNFTEKDAKKTKRTDVAKDVLHEKKKAKEEKCEKEEKEEKECDEPKKKKGLTPGQKKLPEAMQKAILKRQK